MVLSLFYFYHLDMVELVNTLRLGRRDREFESLYPDMHSVVKWESLKSSSWVCSSVGSEWSPLHGRVVGSSPTRPA